MSWNWSYTKRKQKEMAEKSATYQNDPYQYTTYKKPQQNTNEWRREQERQHRVKLISIAIVIIECVIGISVIVYFATQSP